jgi:hypothetical protein
VLRCRCVVCYEAWSEEHSSFKLSGLCLSRVSHEVRSFANFQNGSREPLTSSHTQPPVVGVSHELGVETHSTSLHTLRRSHCNWCCVRVRVSDVCN